jgi:hypothetical protein
MTPGEQRFVRRWNQTRQKPIWWYALRFGVVVALVLTALTFVLDYAIDGYFEPINVTQFVSRILTRVLIFSLGGAFNWFMNERRYQKLTGLDS